MPPGDTSLLPMVLDFGMNRLAAMNIRQAAQRGPWFILCVVWCRSHCDF